MNENGSKIKTICSIVVKSKENGANEVTGKKFSSKILTKNNLITLWNFECNLLERRRYSNNDKRK